MADIEIKRGYEVLPDNNIRFGIRVINTSDSAILDVEVILDYNESLFELEGGKIQNIGPIPPAVPRTAKFILKPRGCIHKEEISATVRYKDPQWRRHTMEMRPKEVHCVCPFLKEKPITRAEFLALSSSGYTEERGANFEAITVDKLLSFLLHTCENRLYLVDEVSIENGRILYLAGDAVGEKAYYLLTAVVKEYEGVIQVLLRAASDKRHGLNGFLNEILDNLRHLVSSVARAREIGIIKREQVINIIDSVVQRTTFATEEGAAPVTIKDSVVQRAEFTSEEAAKRRREEEERLRREKEKQERLHKAEEKKERERKEREEVEKRKRDQEEKARQEAERLKREQAEQERKRQEEERHRKAEEERREEVLIREEITAERAGEKRLEEIERLLEKGVGGKLRANLEVEAKRLKQAKKTSRTKIFAVIIVLGAVLLGLWGFTALYHDGTKLGSPTAGITYTNSLGMEFVLIPAGKFEMGWPWPWSNDLERPYHQVTINQAFYLGKYEVTQEQWRAVMGVNPSYFKGDDLPVEWVSWDDVQEFIKKLNAKEGTDMYRLPSEAEWEYACRAGTTTRYSFGNSESNLGEYAWYDANSGTTTHPVGQKKPNPWGLYDMHGNVWEMVQDVYHDNYDGAPTDGSTWEGSDSSRVERGGSFYDNAWACRSACRGGFDPILCHHYRGFRLVREV